MGDGQTIGNAPHNFGNVVLHGVVIHILLSFMIQSFKQMQGLGKEALSPQNEEAKIMVPFLSPHSSLVRMEMAGSDHRRLEGHPRRGQFAMGFNLCIFKMWTASRW